MRLLAPIISAQCFEFCVTPAFGLRERATYVLFPRQLLFAAALRKMQGDGRKHARQGKIRDVYMAPHQTQELATCQGGAGWRKLRDGGGAARIRMSDRVQESVVICRGVLGAVTAGRYRNPASFIARIAAFMRRHGPPSPCIPWINRAFLIALVESHRHCEPTHPALCTWSTFLSHIQYGHVCSASWIFAENSTF